CRDCGVHEFEEAEGRLPAHLRGGAAVLVADVAASDRRVLAGFPGGGVGLAAAAVRGLLRGRGFAHRGYLSRTSASRSASMVARRCATSSGWLERSVVQMRRATACANWLQVAQADRRLPILAAPVWPRSRHSGQGSAVSSAATPPRVLRTTDSLPARRQPSPSRSASVTPSAMHASSMARQRASISASLLSPSA